MTTQTQYTPEVVELKGGLDLVSPRPTTPPGALIDDLNFEVSDVLGYSRVLGCERFDGRDSPSLAYTQLYVATITQFIGPPSITYVASSSGGTLAAGTYYYVVTRTNAAGQTTKSNEVVPVVSGATSSVVLNWGANPSGTTGIKVYRGTTSGSEVLLATLGNVTTYTDTGAATTSGTPPTTNTASISITQATPFPMVNVGDDTTQAFGIVTAYALYGTSYKAYFYVTNFPKFYKAYSNVANNTSTQVSVDGTTSGILTTIIDITNASTSTTTGVSTLGAYITLAIQQFTTATTAVETACTTNLNGSTLSYNPAIGLQWYKNQQYAICDLNSFVFSNGSSVVQVGDILKNNSTNAQIIVRDITVTSPTWSNNTATGIIYYSLAFPTGSALGNYNSASFGTANTLASLGAIGTTFNILRGSATVANAIQVGAAVSNLIPAKYASMFRSFNYNQLPIGSPFSYQGWQEIDLGYSVQFTSGQSIGPPPAPGRVQIPAAGAITSTAGTSPTTGYDTVSGRAPDTAAPSSFTGTGTWTTNNANWPVAIQQAAAFTANGGSGAFSGKWLNPYTLSIGNNPPSGAAWPWTLQGFSFPDLPNDALVVGVEVGLAGAVNTTAGSPIRFNAALTVRGATVGSYKASGAITSTSPTAPTQFTLGGSGDYWGAGSLTVADISRSDFGVVVYLSSDTAPTAVNTVCCGVYIKIYFQKSSSVYYFWNGTNDVQATIVTSSLTSGTWSANTAAGIMQVNNVQPVGSGARVTIGTGDSIRTAPAGGGALLATVSSQMTFAGLPSLSQIQASNSQYELIVANFFGNKDWESLYGCSGAGRAFTYDGYYFRYIYTGLNATLDVPRHVAFNNFHLCLGYQTGALFASVTGLPESFDGTLGAAEFDTGDPITGLLRMNGTTLGVFCKKSIYGLNGTDPSNFSLNVLSPYEGAIEYTVVDCGKPVYTSYKGVSVFDQTAAYGSFLGTRLSHTVTPFLLPRLTKQLPSLSISANITNAPNATGGALNTIPNTVDSSVAFAMPIRDRNQYKLWFKDGYCLTITFSGPNQEPSTSIQRIDFSTNGTDVLVPLAHSSSIDDNGLDRNHVSYYNPSAGLATTKADNRNYVWELNRGWGFGTSPVRGWFTTTHNFFNNPFQIGTIRKIRLHGSSLGGATINVAVSADYLSRDFLYGNLYGQVQSNAIPQDISLPRGWKNNSPATLSSQFQSETNIANVAKEGRSFAMQFTTTPTTIEPPFVAQALLMQITENKADT